MNRCITNIYLVLFIFSLSLVSCTPATDTHTTKRVITVSINPIKQIVELLTDNDFNINVLVPNGSNPETYEPTQLQMSESANSFLYINTGLIDFEHNINQFIKNNSDSTTVLSINNGVNLINGHDHSASSHNHSTDPHIWLSPRTYVKMIENVYNFLHDKFPDSVRYTNNYNQILSIINSLDLRLQKLFASGNKTFIINHPALSYLARDYNLQQIPIEIEGKEPSVKQVIEIINKGRNSGSKIIFNQKNDNISALQNIANELNASIIIFDPLDEDVINNILNTSQIIANNGTNKIE